jgi:hypothetical protein
MQKGCLHGSLRRRGPETQEEEKEEEKETQGKALIVC